jgi:transposase-like protein
MGGAEVKKRRKYRRFTVEFKVEAVQRMLGGENVKALSRILDVPRSQLYRWLDVYREQGTERLWGPGRRPTLAEPLQTTPAEAAAKRIAELERKVGQQTLEVDFLTRAFKRVKALRQPSTRLGGTASTERSGR